MIPDREPASTESDTPPDGAIELEPSRSPAPRREATGTGDLVPYVVPMCVYVALGGIESYLPLADLRPSPFWYPLAYAARVVLVALLAWRYRSTWSDFRPWPRTGATMLGAGIGLLVWGMWIGLDGRYPPLPFLGKRVGFDAGVLAPLARYSFVAVRMFGLVVLVPLIEELFWRSFLIRWLIDPEFHTVQFARITPTAAAVTSVLFALVHPEWLPALITGGLWAWLLWWTRSLGACLVSHATANLALGLYVIATGDWKYW